MLPLEHANDTMDQKVQNGRNNSPIAPLFTQFVDVSAMGTTMDTTFPAVKDDVLTEEHLLVLIRSGDKKSLKQFVRTNNWPLDQAIRSNLWLHLSKIVHSSYSNIYHETERELYGESAQPLVGISDLVDYTISLNYYLNDAGVITVQKILMVMGHTNPDITYSPALQPLISLLLHYMEPAMCFNCAYGLLRSKKESYLMLTKLGYNASRLVVRDLAKKYAKPTYVYILRNSCNVEEVFQDWLWWIFRDLPFPYLVRIVDCYLIEGVKVLYRMVVAVLILFSKHSAKQTGNQELWTADPAVNISHFCRIIPVKVDKLLKIAFGIRGLARKEIKKLQVKNEMYINSKSKDLKQSPSSWSLGDGSKSAGGTLLQRTDSTVLSKEMHSQRQRSRSVGMIIFPIINSKSLHQEDLYVIWGWLPARSAVCQPKLLYTSEEHGVSLRTLYTRVEDYEQTILVIKTAKDEVFGAYCSMSWRNRKNSSKNISYFGTGESFIFMLHPDRKKYAWIGSLQPENARNAASMFMAGDSSVLIIGGGGGNAIMLNENLMHCRTENCATFDSGPLCSTEDFHCKVVEVFGFQ